MAQPDPQRSDAGRLDPKVAYWKDEIDTYERMFDKFLRRGRKVMKKYRDVRSPREDAQCRYNILWANVKTRMPALYARNPKSVVERRFKDADPVGRCAAEVLERAIQYTLDHCNDAWETNRQAILDFELPGRGTVWIRYVPHFKKQELPAADAEKRPADREGEGEESTASDAAGEATQPLTAGAESQPAHGSEMQIGAEGVQTSNAAQDEVDDETLSYEETKVDYVYWEDYGHSWARVDGEVRGKWRRVYMDREELEERFMASALEKNGLSKEEIGQIPLDWSPKNLTDTKIPVTRKKAIVYEIWDKRRRCIYWLVKNFPRFLDEREDKLGLKDFFPTPRPLMANLCNDDLVPTPNFTFYQDQANEVDELSTRIISITKALKVAGVRDTSAEGLDRLLSEGVENQLVPVEGWAVLKEKGGLAGVFELLPMKEIAETLSFLREQRKELIEDIYQLTGISDIVRGMSDPEETATAQQLKGRFSMIRIEDDQQEVQRFCRDQVVIIGQIVAGYSIETLKQISGVKLLTAREKQEIQMQLAAQQRAQQMQAALAAQAQQPPGGAGQPGTAAPAGVHPGAPAPAPQAMMPPSAGSPVAMHAPVMPAAGGGPAAPQQAPQPGGAMHPGMPSQAITPAPGQAPVSPEKMKLLEEPTWEEVEALLANPVLREFRLDIETDSTVKMDEEAEKKARVELISTVGEFITQMVTAGASAPEILPMLGEVLMFGIRGFKSARSIEQTFEDMMTALEKAAAQASSQPKPPPPEVQKVMAQAQADQQEQAARAASDEKIAQTKAQADAQAKQMELTYKTQADAHQNQLNAQLETHKEAMRAHTEQTLLDIKQHFEAQRIQWETAAKERIAIIEANSRERQAGADRQDKERGRQHERSMQQSQQSHEKSMPKPGGGGNGGGSKKAA
jgi:hypothetical protein